MVMNYSKPPFPFLKLDAWSYTLFKPQLNNLQPEIHANIGKYVGRIRSDAGTSTCSACTNYKTKSIATFTVEQFINSVLHYLPLRTLNLPSSSQQNIPPTTTA